MEGRGLRPASATTVGVVVLYWSLELIRGQKKIDSLMISTPLRISSQRDSRVLIVTRGKDIDKRKMRCWPLLITVHTGPWPVACRQEAGSILVIYKNMPFGNGRRNVVLAHLGHVSGQVLRRQGSTCINFECRARKCVGAPTEDAAFFMPLPTVGSRGTLWAINSFISTRCNLK